MSTKRINPTDTAWHCPSCGAIDYQPRRTEAVGHKCVKARRIVDFKRVK